MENNQNYIADINTITCKYCKSESIVKFGVHKTTENKPIQRYFCKSCNRKFTELDTLPRMRTPVNELTSVISMWYGGMPLDSIQRHLKQEFNNDVTEMTIYRWIIHFTKSAIEQEKLFIPKVGDTWIADESMIEVDGKNLWFWDIIDADSRYLLASHISDKRNFENAQQLMRKAAERANKLPKVIITDKMRAYIDGIALTLGNNVLHIRSKPFVDKSVSTNKIERFHGTLKDRINVIRGFKNANTAQLLTDGWLIHYNFFKEHESLGNRPPAQAMGIQTPFKNWISVVRTSPYITKQERQPTPITEMLSIPIPMTPQQQYKSKIREYDRKYYAEHKKHRLANKQTPRMTTPSMKGIRWPRNTRSEKY